MRVASYILLAMSFACSGNTSNRQRASEATAAVGEDETAGAIVETAQGSLPTDHERMTFSTYAEVTAADVVEIVVRVDNELDTQVKEKLAAGIDALLKHIINSNWRVALSELDTTAYPTQFITKYTDYASYAKKFAAALGVGKAEPTTAPQPKRAPEAEQPVSSEPRAGLEPRSAPAVTLRVFIIVTAQSLAETKLATDKAVLADREDAPLTKVYAILNTAEGIDDYLNWKNAQDKNVLSRYGALQSNYPSMLEDFSADIANTLRGIFLVPPTPSDIVQNNLEPKRQARAEDVTIAQLKVFNAPEAKEAQEGFIHDSHYQVKERIIFTRAKFVEGTCVDVTLAR